MPRRYIHISRFAVTVLALLFLFSERAAGQRVEDSCHAFFDDAHQSLDCVEAVFTQTDIPYGFPHLTVSSVPPGNGFPIGIVWDKRNYFVSSPFYDQSQPNKPSEGYKSLVDATAGAVISTNGSWYASGAVTWLPPIHYHSEKMRDGETCHRLWAFCTKQMFGVQFSVTHRTLQTINFYGLGPASPNTQLSYRQSETYGGALARMPLFNWLVVAGQVENRAPGIQFSSTSLATGTINESSAPGFSTQPDFMHYSAQIQSHAQVDLEPKTNDPAGTPPGVTPPPLMKHKLVWTFDNGVTQHWFQELNNGQYSFHQTVVEGKEAIEMHAIIRRFVSPNDMTTRLKILKHFCNQRKSGLKQQDECNFGEILFHPYLVLSDSSSGVVPFYFQPTLGGSDIESRMTLRGFNDYRFRAPDAALISIDYRIPVFNPIGAMIFYDAGNVGNSIGALSFGHARQDAGVGPTLLVMKYLIAQMYFGWGAGHGSHFGYNFTKFF